MARWQPPIPADKLYSAPARKLGAGIVLLLWCYDGVDRKTGVVKVSLTDATEALEDESYHTVKKWWHALKHGPFFTEIKDCGKNGFEATFHPDWIDWRQMAGQRPVKESSSASEVPQAVLEDDNTSAQSAVKDSSRTNDVPPVVLETSAYKVPNTPDQAGIAAIASDDAPPPRKRVAKPGDTEPPTPASIRALIADLCSIDLAGKTATRAQAASLNAEAKKLWQAAQSQGKTESECLEAIRYVGGWIARTVYPYSSGQPLTPAALRERWRAAMDAKAKRPAYVNGTNGIHPTGPPPERRPTPEETARAAAKFDPFGDT